MTKVEAFNLPWSGKPIPSTIGIDDTYCGIYNTNNVLVLQVPTATGTYEQAEEFAKVVATVMYTWAKMCDIATPLFDPLEKS